MKIIPDSFCNIVPKKLLFLKVSVIDAEDQARNRHQSVPVTRNVAPRIRKGMGPFAKSGLINWGRKDKKNNATLGFKTFVMTPCLYMVIKSFALYPDCEVLKVLVF